MIHMKGKKMSETEHKLYVGNLSYQVDEAALSSFFETNGMTVQNVTVIKDKYTERSKGFGFVEVSSQQEVDNAISTMNEKELDGRTITVSQARPREERRNFSGPRGGGGNRGGQGGRGGGGGRSDNRFGKRPSRY